MWSFSISVSGAALALAAACLYAQGRYGSAVPAGVFRLILPYAAIFALAAVRTIYPWNTSVEAYRLSCALLLFSGTVFFCGDRGGIRNFCLVLALVAGALSFVSLLQYLGGLPHDWWKPVDFPASVYVNHNHFAGLLEITLPLTLGALLAEPQKSKRVILALSGILSLVALLFTFSRGGYAAIFVAMGFQFFWLVRLQLLRKKRAMMFLWSAAAASVLALFGTQHVVDRVRSFSGMWQGEASWMDRLQIWRSALGQITRHFWFGTGPGTFEFAALPFRVRGFDGRAVYAHNDYLHLWAELGVFGLVAGLALWGALFLRGLRILEKGKSRTRIGVVSGCLATLVALAVHSLFDFNFHLPANFMLMAVIAGMILSFDTATHGVAALPSPLIARRKWMNVGLAAFVLGQAVYFGWPDVSFARAIVARKNNQPGAARDYLARVAMWNPLRAEAHYQKALAEAALDERREADKDFERAIRANPLEPYYEFQKAKNLLAGGNENACAPAAVLVKSATNKDPHDPRLLFLGGRLLLQCAGTAGSYEKAALSLMARAVRSDKEYAQQAAAAIWDAHPGDPEKLKRFLIQAPSAGEGILLFFDRRDLWKFHRPFLLQTLGINIPWREKFLHSDRWDEKNAVYFEMRDLDERADELPIRDGEYFYRNGEIGAEIDFKTHFNRVILRARGTSAKGSYPMLLVKLDDQIHDAVYVDSFALTEFYALVKVRPGKHRLSLEFVNDAADGRMDRNLWISGLRVDPDGANK